ncbi:DUF2947 domain-containing protein [Agarivorans sp. MS3-6]|uniref:DUF2947 domain-containing protein n=1 Tax=Agarivorans sp. TSD2052 TaxID=2937286 RepID=UPI00200DA0BB|nr:DUF2947 domain-containing protein [Agarivorans sp. TSD2052]UPW16836.1 DUF2947 domain-containing protein [Agarivorans sp. TSD2052]
MNYIALSEHKKAWIFRRTDLPISEDDTTAIKPMTEERAAVLWKDLVSKQVDHPDFFKKGDWAFSLDTWSEQGNWEDVWDSQQKSLPDELLEHLQWQDNTVVYYCNDQRSVIETTWDVFKRCWKNFLFMDDGALLIAKKRSEVAQFLSNGSYQLGHKPK